MTGLMLIDYPPITDALCILLSGPKGALFNFGKNAGLALGESQFSTQGALDQIELDLRGGG